MMFFEISSEGIGVQTREFKAESGSFVLFCVSKVVYQDFSSEPVFVGNIGWGFLGDG